MTAAVFPPLKARSARFSARLSPYLLAALAILAAAFAWQAWIGFWGDVTWLIIANERWLAGERAYVDFIEFNPPASLMLYTPAVALARGIGARSEFIVALYGFALISLVLALCFAILGRAGKLVEVGPVTFVATLIALAFLPGDAFMERDVVAAWFGMPFLALSWARAERAPVSVWHALAAGVGVGFMVALKPPFAPAVLAPGVYLLARLGWRPLLAAVEIPAAAAVLFVYAVVTMLAFPAYSANVWPGVANVYLAVRQSALELVDTEGGLDFLTLAALGGLLARKDFRRPPVAIAGLAALGAFAGYFLQGKGWLYQAYPALAYAAIFVGLAGERALAAPRDRVFAALAFLVALAAGIFIDHWGVSIMIATLGMAALSRLLARDGVELATMLSRLGAAATLGAACAGFVPGGQPSNALGRALSELGSHPTTMAITESFGFVHPMARRRGAIWVQSEPTLLMTAAARRLIDEHPGDAALAAKLAPYIAAERDRLVADIAAKRPEAILVGPLNTRFHAAIWAEPRVQAAMAGYRLYAVNDEPGSPGELWVRRDLAEPRPILAPGTEP